MVYISDSVFETENCAEISLLFSYKLFFSLQYFNPDLPRCQVLLNQHSPDLFEFGWEKINNFFKL